jgi:hypothetical protein
MRSICVIFLMVFFSGIPSWSQTNDSIKFHPHHSIGLVIGHTQISQGIQSDGQRKWLSLPVWAINYNFKFKPQWALGLHTDIIFEDFLVEEHLNNSQEKVLERKYPIASALMATYKPFKHVSFLLGTGAEFSHSGNLFLVRCGFEYSYHFANNFELNAIITNDLKVNAYNSWSIGLGVSKVF